MKTPVAPPMLGEILEGLDSVRLQRVAANMSVSTVNGKYLHWDQLRHRPPPDDLTSEEWWAALKLARSQSRKQLPFIDTEGVRLTYMLTDEALSMLHRIDRFASGNIEAPDAITNEATRNRYLISSLMEEAIASSLLEGAATTRRDAKRLLRSGRRPNTAAEQMVVNNYMTMRMIRSDLDAPLTVQMILEIHRTVTEGTLDRLEDAGRMQAPGEGRVDIGDPVDGTIVFHQPPPAEDLPKLLDELVAFANTVDDEPFVHPVVRAIGLHFWLSYIHPFVDGNGRTARALFYRSMLRQGYWLTEYISISRLLLEAPTQYGRSFLYTETDEADMTYFLLHQLKVLCRAIDELLAYLETKVTDVRRVQRALRSVESLNHRQLALLSDALVHPDTVHTFESHKTTYNVSYQTARADLLDLTNLGFLEKSKVSRQFWFYAVGDLEDRVLGTP